MSRNPLSDPLFLAMLGPRGVNVSAITYRQSSLWPGSAAASNANMTDGLFTNNGAAANSSPSPSFVEMDLGSSQPVARVIIGTATNNIPGGWSRTFTQNCNVQHSNDQTNWTTAFNTTNVNLPADGIYEFAVNFTARYIRITPNGTGFVAISEFYALGPGQSYP
jgi:F5/8 type C domain